MSRKYKYLNPEGLYFISFATVYWIDVFVRDIYCNVITDALDYCRRNKGLMIHSWCIMPSHIHLIFKAQNNNPQEVTGQLKTYISKQLQKSIEENPQESRKEWMLWMMERAASKSSNVKK